MCERVDHARVRELNDEFRRTLTGGVAVCTRAVADTFTLPERDAIMQQVAAQTEFDPGNDPYGEHDFGVVQYRGHRLWWKIDYYDNSMERHSPDPTNPDETVRVLTILFPSDY